MKSRLNWPGHAMAAMSPKKTGMRVMPWFWITISV